MQLIIVESPTKAKTFAKFLNKDQFQIASSMGHIRDLPISKLGIDIKNNFEPQYQIMVKKRALVKELVNLAQKAKTVVLATDPDREGEAIAFHLWTIFQNELPKKDFKRIVFHEITEEALQEALANPGEINKQLFNAQQARRVLDRLVGYQVSPFLWKSFSKRWLSAGRVQSVALKLLVEREKERNKFPASDYFLIKADFSSRKTLLKAKLITLLGKTFFLNNKFPLFDGVYQYQTSILTNEEEKNREEKRLLKTDYLIDQIEENKTTRAPAPPFTTSSLQQFGANYLGFSAKRTMQIAQSLYEQGLITYHRTDSFNLAGKFIQAARSYINKRFGKEYLPAAERVYRTKSKLAQEAHEAIRPTNITYSPEEAAKNLSREQNKLYRAIYNRSLATQMKEALILKQKILIKSSQEDFFQTENEKILFPGFLLLENNNREDSNIIANLEKGSTVQLAKLEFEKKTTLPPPYYSEASLIKTLEEKGIGRPSTYAPIISLLLERQYVQKEERALKPTQLGIQVSDLLSKKFVDIFAVEFTAAMEDQLDAIAQSGKDWVKVVTEFYEPLHNQLEKALANVEKIKLEEPTNESCPLCKAPLVIKLSKYGKFFACSKFPDCKYTKSFLQGTGKPCPKCQKGELVVRRSRFKRRFYACNRYPECDYTCLWLTTKSDPKSKAEHSTPR